MYPLQTTTTRMSPLDVPSTPRHPERTARDLLFHESQPFGSSQEPTNALAGKGVVSNPYNSREARTCLLTSVF